MEKMTPITSSTVPYQRLAGKVAIITGGASGVGESTVQLFHKNGAKVVIADIQDKLGQALAKNLGENATYIHCDVSSEDEIIKLINKTVEKYGKLDIMYNNAGIIDRVYGSILDSKKSELDRLLRVNVVGAFLGAKHAAMVMKPRAQGCILFTSSACTETAGLSTHSYAITKNAILGLAKNLASELGQYGIRVNVISPLGMATAMTGPIRIKAMIPIAEAALGSLGNLKGEVLQPQAVAKAALYLAGDEAKAVTGLNLVVDGGYSVVNPTFSKYLVWYTRIGSLSQWLRRPGVQSKFLFTGLVLSFIYYFVFLNVITRFN